jgi:hypothetical protein
MGRQAVVALMQNEAYSLGALFKVDVGVPSPKCDVDRPTATQDRRGNDVTTRDYYWGMTRLIFLSTLGSAIVVDCPSRFFRALGLLPVLCDLPDFILSHKEQRQQHQQSERRRELDKAARTIYSLKVGGPAVPRAPGQGAKKCKSLSTDPEEK